MAVEEDDFGDLFTGNLAFTTQAQHVLRVVTFIQVAHAGLAGKKRTKAFALQVIEEGNGRDVRVSV